MEKWLPEEMRNDAIVAFTFFIPDDNKKRYSPFFFFALSLSLLLLLPLLYSRQFSISASPRLHNNKKKIKLFDTFSHFLRSPVVHQEDGHLLLLLLLLLVGFFFLISGRWLHIVT